ncbi:Ectonucleotide pyrophosphatase/phosphodiesterase family member 2 [Liparis tanakae]|uniref:Ectonucleotide pyrophosphatase/phosphodiesterase family member 2 n=1 Tax=Liparis tanakae TaxID=230148 RepID=A0A4Z2GW95_9TELE|nr:Ectonucleotide pyrophosphatase/phosphodiesterase family member 2 [Liparis tanakae]
MRQDNFIRPPLIMLSVDGFRASYLKKGNSVIPNIHKLSTSPSLQKTDIHCPELRVFGPGEDAGEPRTASGKATPSFVSGASDRV